jgi:hypothetical protein
MAGSNVSGPIGGGGGNFNLTQFSQLFGTLDNGAWVLIGTIYSHYLTHNGGVGVDAAIQQTFNAIVPLLTQMSTAMGNVKGQAA